MGQEVRAVPEAPALSDGDGGSPATAIGPFLAQQRRLRGISLDELSTRTRIPLRSLERLEAGAFDQVSDGFTRGFVRTVADALGLDADDAVARLLAEPVEEGAEDAPRRLQRALTLTAALVVALAAAVVVVWGLRAALDSRSPAAGDSELLYRRDAVRALAETLDGPAVLGEVPSRLAPIPDPAPAARP